jgi:peptidoglycan/LPS O-acetylase OafA/YrhL
MSEIHIKRLMEIDTIKVISVMLIIIHHGDAFLYHYIFGNLDPYLGRVGLALFTFVSGYALYKNNVQISSIKAFYKKRLLRIYPLYLLALFLYVILSNFKLWRTFTDATLVAHILGLQMLIYPYIQPDGLLWYIGMIFIFYGVYPFLINKSKTPLKLIWNAGVILVLLTLLRVFFGIIEIRNFVYFPIFITGILTAWIGIPKKLKILVPIFLVPLIYIRLKWLTMDASDPINNNAIPVVLSMSLMLIFFSLIIFEWVKSIQLSSRIAAIVSKIAIASYPLYLFHPLVLYSLKSISHYLNSNPIIFDLFMISIVIPIFIIICYYIQIYEMKILSVSWINHIFDKLTF